MRAASGGGESSVVSSKSRRNRARAFLGATVIWMCLGGCSTAIFSENRASGRTVTVEREALAAAAAAVAETKWPEPQEESWGARLAGFIAGGDEAGKDGAVSAYLASMPPGAAPQAVIFADAARHLAAAAALAEAADAAAQSIRPQKNDIAIVESAIARLRENRDIYVAALKAVDRAGEPVDEDAIRLLKAEFNQAIKAVGAAADQLADSIARERNATFVAEPLAPPAARGEFAGSF